MLNWFRGIIVCMLLMVAFTLVAMANDATLRVDPFNTLPDSNTGTFRTNSRVYWEHEKAQHDGRYFSAFVDSGGLHGESSSLVSFPFATIAYVPERINQVATAITYAAIANDICWTIISSDNNGITGWTRVGTTSYYYQCEGDTTPNQPDLPANSAWLMRITVTTSTIATVTDLRKLFLEGVMHIERSASFVAAINEYGGTGQPRVTLMLSSRMHVTTNTTLPSNISLQVTSGGRMEIGAGITLTLPCDRIFAAEDIIFTGAGSVVCSTYPSYGVSIRWFATGDGVTNDTVGIAMATVASPRLAWSTGTYLTDPITITGQGILWRGSRISNIAGSANRTIIRARGTQAHVLRYSGQLSRFEDLILDGAGTTTQTLHIISPTTQVEFNNIIVQDPTPAPTGRVVFLDGGVSQIDKVVFRNCSINGDIDITGAQRAQVGVLISGSNVFLNTFDNCNIRNAIRLVQFDLGSGADFINHTQFEEYTSAAVYINGGPLQNVRFSQCYTETAGTFLTGSSSYASLGIGTIIIEQCRFNAAASLTLYAGQPFLLIGNSFNTNVDVEPSAGGVFFTPPISIGNSFSSPFDFSGSRGAQVIEVGDTLAATVPRTRLRSLIVGWSGIPAGGAGASDTSRIRHGSVTFPTAASVVQSFSPAESDENYRVVLTGNRNETFWVTGKTAGQFTINSSNVASSATIDWWLYRN